MTIDIWVAYAALGAIVLLVCFLCRAFTHINKLQHEFYRLNSHDVDLLDKYHFLEKQFMNLANDFEKLKGSVEVVRSEKTSGQNYIYLKSIAESIEKMVSDYSTSMELPDKEELDIPKPKVLKSFDKVIDSLNKALYGDDLDDEEKPEQEEKIEVGVKFCGYRWIFPTMEESHPVFGQWYKVVGRIKGKDKPDGSPLLCTEDGMWNNYEFVTTKGDRFDIVYAYIKMPDSGDIMEQIVQLALKDKE